MSRLVLAASGAAAAFVTLLPAAIAALIALFDGSAHGLLGMSGTLLGLAAPFGGSGGAGLAAYHGVGVDPARAALVSFACGLPPIGMIGLAATRATTRAHWPAAAACGAASVVTAGWSALPGCLAALALVWQSGCSPPTPPTIRPSDRVT